MSVSFLTNVSEQEFREFLKQAIKEVLSDQLGRVKADLPDILDIEQAAKFLKRKVTTLYEKTSHKLIPHYKEGNKLYFIRTELEEWIKKKKIKTGEEIEGNAMNHLLTSKRPGRNKS